MTDSIPTPPRSLDSLRASIRRLELDSRDLDPGPETIQTWTRQVGVFAAEFVADLESGPAFKALEQNQPQHFPISETPGSLDALLVELRDKVLAFGLNPASGGHLGYIPGGGIVPTALGDYLAAITNQYAGMFFAGPGAVRLEHDLIRWMCQLVGFPTTALGNLTSGGSMANLIALATAREAQKVRAAEIHRAVIYVTEQVHHCVHKAIRIGGMAESIVRLVPMDGAFRLDPVHLIQQIQTDRANGLRPFLVVASAGTTDTGSIDPLDEIARICSETGIWMHVDAAYGGFFLLAADGGDQGRILSEKFRGIERANSIAIDPHKGLFLSYGLGAVLVQDVGPLHRAHHYRASYMQDTLRATEELNPADLSPELTKHFRGLRMWLALRMVGLEPFRAALKEKLLLCQLFHTAVRDLGFEVGPQPELSVCIYRFIPTEGDPNEFNRRLVETIQRDGRVFVSSTTISGQVWLRLAVLCFRTHLEEIDYLLDFLARAVR